MLYDEIFTNIDYLPKTLSSYETRELLIKAKNNDIEARNKLIEHNIKLVIYIVDKKFSFTNYPKKELVSIGIDAIFKAIINFDMDMKTEFSTFLYKSVINEILVYMKINKRSYKRLSTISFYSPSKINEDSLLIDTLKSPMNLENDYINHVIYNYIDELVASLPDKKRNVIELYYGFNGNDKKTQVEVGKRLNTSRQNVNKLLKESIETLRNRLIKDGIVEVRDKKERKQAPYKSIYEYFKNYTKEEIDYAISRLNDYYMELIKRKFWNDFDNQDNKILDKDDKKTFYDNIVPRIKKLIKEKD